MSRSSKKKARRPKARTAHSNTIGASAIPLSKATQGIVGPTRFLQCDWPWALLLVAATILTYQQTWHAGFIWDDDEYVTENKLLTTADGLRRIWFSFDSPSQYFPLVYTTFRFEHALWGSHPAGYHWVNILLHAANALLVWRLLRVLRVPGAWLAAAIFALHPVHVESVAWITERKNVLMGFFFLLALLSWIEFVEERSRGRWKFYALALTLYTLALFSKTTACTLPAALLLVLWLKKKPIGWGRLVQIGPFVALGIGMGLLTMWWERYHQGTQGELFTIGVPERILVASRALWFYAGKLLWPAHLSFSYPRWTISAANPLDYVWLLATAALGIAIYLARRYVGRSVEVAAIFFVTTLSPLLGFIMLYTFRYSFVADHYQYLASIGPLALAAAGITTAFGFLEKRKSFLMPILCGALLLSLAMRSWRQSATFTDLDTLWQATISENPGSSMAHNNLGIRLLHAGQVDEAIAHLIKALEIKPDYTEARYNLGNAFRRIGRLKEAIACYDQVLATNGNFAEAHNNLGNSLLQTGRLDEAVAHLQKAVEINPNYAEAHYNLGNIFLRTERLNEAVAHFRKALEIDPNNPPAHNNLGNALVKTGRFDDAVVQYRAAIEINPNYGTAHKNLGETLLRLGRTDEARPHLQRSREMDSQLLPHAQQPR